MESKSKAPLIVIIGPTGAGKSALAMAIAKKFNGEIISGDSRHIYKNLDIGTDKPSLKDRNKIKHHLIDLYNPDQSLTVADFKPLAIKAIKQVNNRGNLPILVGGSGLYIDAVIYNFSFRKSKTKTPRTKLEKMSVTALQAEIEKRGLSLPFNQKNPRHLIRILEAGAELKQDSRIRPNTLLIGIDLKPDDLNQRIIDRLDNMISNGLIEEVANLSKKYGWEHEPLKSIGYREFKLFFEGRADIGQTKELILRDTIQYTKRQKTWFKRNKNIHWVDQQRQAVDLVTTFLNK